LTLLALIGAAAAPWAIRWRPWQLLGQGDLFTGIMLDAEEPNPMPPDADSSLGSEAGEASEAMATEPSVAPRPAAAVKAARLEPYIIPLETDTGGAP
jgi:hypothetical protein